MTSVAVKKGRILFKRTKEIREGGAFVKVIYNRLASY